MLLVMIPLYGSVIWFCFLLSVSRSVMSSVGCGESDVLLLLLGRVTRSYNYSIYCDCNMGCTVNLVQIVTRDILYNNMIYL